jgi:hypothetical protein
MLSSRRGTPGHTITKPTDMNPPPPLEIIQCLMHSDVDSVCFYRYEGHLTFENKNRLSFSAPFRFAEGPILPDAPAFEFPLSDTNLVRLLGYQVSQVKCDADGTLELRFSNGDVLIVYANDPAYEAYTLFIDGKEHVV